MNPIAELLYTVGKLAIEEGEAWRLAHPELMDAYQACQTQYQRQCNNKVKPTINKICVTCSKPFECYTDAKVEICQSCAYEKWAIEQATTDAASKDKEGA